LVFQTFQNHFLRSPWLTHVHQSQNFLPYRNPPANLFICMPSFIRQRIYSSACHLSTKLSRRSIL
jgi:hypothetical protein